MTVHIPAHLAAAAHKCATYDQLLAEYIGVALAHGVTAEKAHGLAKQTLEDRAPSESERFDTIRYEMLARRLDREATAVNAAVERMAVRA